MSSKITYYPVDNGDQSMISIEEGYYTTNILVDCNIRESSKGSADLTMFDVKADLLKSLKKREINNVGDSTYADIFILTHGDLDHLRGFENNFYQGDPQKFTKKNKDNGEIFIDVLWFSPMVMGESTSDDENCFNKEAQRRIDLHRKKSVYKDLPGNRIVIIGYDANDDLSDLDLVRKIPGDIVTRFNNRDLLTFSIFLHAPYKKQLTQSDPDKNHTSVVFQARFKEELKSDTFSSLAMFGGDSDHYSWDMILQKTKKHENEKALEWDIFMAPHHCSWTFFNDTPQKDNPLPVKTALDVLDYARNQAKVIASSKKILNNDDNPPHYKAKEQYVKKVTAENFFNTSTKYVKGVTPQPIVFEVTKYGPVLQPEKIGTATAAGTSTGTGNNPTRYGTI